MPSIENIIYQVNRLYDNFACATSRTIRDEKIRFLQRELQNMPDPKFVQICDVIIKETKSKTFPTISDILSISRDMRNEDEEIKYCDKCDNTGYYTVWQRRQEMDRYYHFAFRCTCNIINLSMPLISPDNIPTKTHNPRPPSDPQHHADNKEDKEKRKII